MKHATLKVLLGLGCVALGARAVRAKENPEPLWAYGYLTPPAPDAKARSQQPPPTSRNLLITEPPEEQTRPRHVEGSGASFSKVDIRDGGNVADWFPGDHPPMLNVISRGPASLGKTSWGCAYCHLPTGKGRPENAPVAGQPVAYFLRQLEDFRNDARTSADPRKPNTPIMAGLAKAMSDEEMKEAAGYFGAIRWTPWTRVVETDLVPKTKIEGNLFQAIERERTEPIAGRIIEVPEDPEQSEGLRNPRSGFIAYVPVGSIKKGENLVTTGGMSVVDGKIVPGKTIVCAGCHGPDLMGLVDVPGIAGRSPSYLVRQMYDLQQGTRKGRSSPLMQPVVANLTTGDMVAIAAYVASLAPPPAANPL
ncbi:MAG: c-type cytochrome [Opitutaceae bacterium]